MTIEELVALGIDLLKSAGIEGAQSDVLIILSELLNEDKSYILAHNRDRVPVSTIRRAKKLFNQRAERQPLSYVLGYKEFYGLRIATDTRALTPRIETEALVKQVIERAPKNARILDIGTGTGAIAIAIHRHRPDVSIVATDVSPAALELAQENIQQILGESSIKLLVSDLFANVTGTFSVITANLPYVRPDYDVMPEVSHEPNIALFGGTDGLLLYRQFFDQVTEYLKPRGFVFVESDPWQQTDLDTLAMQHNLQRVYQDYFITGWQYQF